MEDGLVGDKKELQCAATCSGGAGSSLNLCFLYLLVVVSRWDRVGENVQHCVKMRGDPIG